MKNVLLVVLCAAGVSLQAQTRPEPTAQAPLQGPTFRTGIDVIAVDVAVVDSRGRPVEDLRAPEFAVKIDGVARRVVSAELVRIDAEAARKQAADPLESLYTTNMTPPNGRLIVLAVDQVGIRAGGGRPVLNAAAKFVDALTPADRVAFVAYPPPGVAVDFTTDRPLLKRAMERVIGQKQRPMGKFNIGLSEAIAIEEKQDNLVFETVLARECPNMTGFLLEQCGREVLFETSIAVANTRRDTTESLRSLRALLEQLAVIEGPKSLILISEGLILERPTDLNDIIAIAATSRVSINVLMMDVPRDDITVSFIRPTITEDRALQTSGLQDLAASTRGALYNVLGTGEAIFERLLTEMSAYYLLGVEQVATDRDGGRHRIDVEVLRRGTTVRSRRAFVLSSPSDTRRKPEEVLIDALKAPFGVAEVPLRATTFTRQDTDAGKVRLILAAEVGQPGTASDEYTVGYALIDAGGAVVASSAEKRRLTAPAGTTAAPLDYLQEVVVPPGIYSLRFGVVDPAGRRGGVAREVRAWKLAGEEFALGDLLIGPLSTDAAGPALRPGVEPRVRGRLGALIELHASSAAALDSSTVIFEIADEPDGPALLTSPAAASPGESPNSRVARGIIAPDVLPPGRYIARARVVRNGAVAGMLVRPFVLEAPDPAAGAAVVAVPSRALTLGPIAKFEAASVLSRDTVNVMLGAVEDAYPALKGALADARAGQYGAAALEAFNAGNQDAAAFLKGLDWYAKGQLDQAATQLRLAAGPRNEFFPAAFFLGASLAAAGRDRDAAGVWQLALGKQARPTLVYLLAADARLRAGQPAAAVEILKPAYERAPADDELARRLATAYLADKRYAEAIPVLDGYLTRHPTDAEALFAAVFSQYQITAADGLTLSNEVKTKLAGYVRGYRGPEQALLQKYLDALRSR